MSTYQQIDGLIVEAIRMRRNALYTESVCGEARRLADITGREDFRIIDARLSALKKAGRIAYRTKKAAKADGSPPGWSVL